LALTGRYHVADILTVGVVITLGAIVAFILLSVVSSRSQDRDRGLRHKEIMAAIEKGVDVPADLLPEGSADKGSGPSNALKTGLISLGIGIGLVTALRLAGSGYWGWGLVVVGLGVAHLVYWFVLGKLEWEEARRADREAKEARVRSSSSRATAPDEMPPQ
jgi:hypothetical protein